MRVADVRFIAELYPRLRPSDDAIARYQDVLDWGPRVRALLAGHLTRARWAPDIAARRRFAARDVLVFIDAKAGQRWKDTGNHDVELAAADAAEAWADFSQCPVWFVFADRTVTTPDRIRTAGAQGKFRGNGSGTPFVLISRDICEPFDAIFGMRETT
jgi:hypothetical protein